MKTTRVHVGSGTIYLEDWLNVDMNSPNTFLAKDRQDLVEKYKTTEDKYYERHENRTIEDFSKGPLKQEYVCDAYGHFASIPIHDGEATEILARQAFEHLSIKEAREALDYIEAKLKPGGCLRLDVPDLEKSLETLATCKDLEFYKRHILGPRSTEYGYHLVGYTREKLKTLVEEHGLVFEAEEDNIHNYPAICLRFRKPGIRPAWEYLNGMFNEPVNGETVLELGPGTNPYPKATHYADHSPHLIKNLLDSGKQATQTNFENKLPFLDKHFDFVFASHVVEHIENIELFLQEISRIGKRGVIIVPSMYKDFMFNWEEGDHKWLFLPNDNPKSQLKAFRMNYEFRSVTADSNFCKSMSRLFRTGPNRHDAEQRLLRKWFYEKEKYLDVVYIWKDKIDFRILE